MSPQDHCFNPFEALSDEFSRDDNALVDGVPVRDWRALVDYLSNNDTPEAHTAMHLRLMLDSAFAEFAKPIIAVWQAPVPRRRHTLASGWADVKQRAAALRAARSQPH